MLAKLCILVLLALVVCPLTAPFQTYDAGSSAESTLTTTDAQPRIGQPVPGPGRLALAAARSSISTVLERLTPFLPPPIFHRTHARPFAERSVLRV